MKRRPCLTKTFFRVIITPAMKMLAARKEPFRKKVSAFLPSSIGFFIFLTICGIFIASIHTLFAENKTAQIFSILAIVTNSYILHGFIILWRKARWFKYLSLKDGRKPPLLSEPPDFFDAMKN